MLDTNVLSELGKPDINESVDAWSRRHENDPFFISAVSVAEIKSGLPFMQEGRKKRAMAEILDKHIRRGGCLPFDESCAPHYTAILVQKGWGKKAPQRRSKAADMMIAATALRHHLVVVTRDKDFIGIDNLAVINPWKVKI